MQNHHNKFFANMLLSPSSSSILSNWLYLANLSPLQGAPLLISPHPSPTARSAIKLSSVSPLLWLTITFHLLSIESLAAANDSVIVPIWFTFSNSALHAFVEIAFFILFTFVTSRSSPTICTLFPFLLFLPTLFVNS